MKTIAFIVLTIVSFFQAQISSNDFKTLFGEWKGDLTYSDYRSGKPVKIPVEIKVTDLRADKNSIVLFYQYPKEPHENGYDTLRIVGGGKMLNDKKIVAVAKNDDVITITAEKQGSDNDKPATLRYTYQFSNRKFSIKKEVRYNDAENFFFRNEYALSR